MKKENDEVEERAREVSKDRISLCETLDRVLNKGAVVAGEIVISVADIDLLYLGLQLTLTSVETANELKVTLSPRVSSVNGEP